MSAKHTPGPWDMGANGYGTPGYIYCDDAFGSAVAISYGGSLNYSCLPREQQEANARLIATAPELLEALQAIVKSLADQDDEGMIEHAEQMIAARAAIAKATGEQS